MEEQRGECGDSESGKQGNVPAGLGQWVRNSLPRQRRAKHQERGGGRLGHRRQRSPHVTGVQPRGVPQQRPRSDHEGAHPEEPTQGRETWKRRQRGSHEQQADGDVRPCCTGLQRPLWNPARDEALVDPDAERVEGLREHDGGRRRGHETDDGCKDFPPAAGQNQSQTYEPQARRDVRLQRGPVLPELHEQRRLHDPARTDDGRERKRQQTRDRPRGRRVHELAGRWGHEPWARMSSERCGSRRGPRSRRSRAARRPRSGRPSRARSSTRCWDTASPPSAGSCA